MRIAEMPADERPLDRMIAHGPHTLSDAELCAILADTTTLEEARTMIQHGLKHLSQSSWMVKYQSKIQQKRHARVLAAFELGRRLTCISDVERDPVRDPLNLARGLVARYSHHQQERLGAVYLDGKFRPIIEREIYVGTINSTTVSTRDVLKIGMEVGAVGIVLFHNHPSGDPSPSAEDILFTRQMIEAAKLMGFEIIDHIVIGFNKYVSLKQRGVVP